MFLTAISIWISLFRTSISYRKCDGKESKIKIQKYFADGINISSLLRNCPLFRLLCDFVEEKPKKEDRRFPLVTGCFTLFFTPDVENTKNFIARDRFLVTPYSVKLKVLFALSVQLHVREKEKFCAKVFIQLDDVVLHSLVVSKSAL